MIRRPPRSTQSRSSAASDVYKRQRLYRVNGALEMYRFRIKTSEMFQVEDMVLFSHLVVTTVRLMRGSDTESRSLPVTVASVPPLLTNVQTRVTYSQGLFEVVFTARSELREVLFLTPSVCGIWATVCKTVCPMLSDRCPVLPVTFVYCGQTVGRNKMKLGKQVGLGRGHIVLDADPAPLPKGAHPQSNFRPISVAAKWLHGSRCHLVWR